MTQAFRVDHTGTPLKRMAGALALLLILPACAFRPQVSSMAVDHNEFLADVTNRQTVLNIIRAREREPMHFSNLGEITGSLRLTSNAGTDFTINGDSRDLTSTQTELSRLNDSGVITARDKTIQSVGIVRNDVNSILPKLSISVNTGTDFKVMPNITDEFYKGIVSSIPDTTIVNFLRQGYPSDLISHLVIREISISAEIYEADMVGSARKPKKDARPILTLNLANYKNSPDTEKDVRMFAWAIACRALDYEVVKKDGLTINAESLSAFSSIPADVIAKIRGVGSPSDFDRYAYGGGAKTTYELALGAPNEADCKVTRDDISRRFVEEYSKNDNKYKYIGESFVINKLISKEKVYKALIESKSILNIKLSSTNSLGSEFSGESYFNEVLDGNYVGKLNINITIRSPEGLMYYLGEYIRNYDVSPKLRFDGDCKKVSYAYGEELDNKFLDEKMSKNFCMPIFKLVENFGELDADHRFVEVSHRGKRYVVPLSGSVLSKEAGRSSHVIGLVQQIFNLHRTSKDVPTTPLLKVIN